MLDLHIASTQSNPSVEAIRESGILEMRGDSYPENSYEFFTPVVTWVRDYLSQGKAPLTLELYLLYLNTSSVKAMMDIFDLMEDAHDNGKEVTVHWYYDHDNERIAELAEEFKEDCSFPFEIVLRETEVHEN